jgi:hypothetical protein
MRAVYDSQEFGRAPTIKRLREAIAEARTDDPGWVAKTARETREAEWLQRYREISWEQFRDGVLAGTIKPRNEAGFKWLRKILERNAVKRGLAAIRDMETVRQPGEEA